jgi:RNA polymerase sigma-70 factor (ECF subfamily)
MSSEAYVMGQSPASAVDADSAPCSRLDREAFRRAYENAAPALRSYVRRTTGSADLADDIVQEAFLRVLRRALPPLNDRELKSYLFKTATSLLNDHWRRISREQRWRSLVAFRGPVARESAAVTGIDRLFHTLKPRERALLWLAYVEGYSHEEVAAVLGLAEKSIRVLLFRARRKMAKLLAGEVSRPEGTR